MKKLFSLILALSLALTLIPALAEETATETNTVLGEWTMTEMLGDNMSYSPSAFGMGMQITFYEDGTMLAVTTYQDPTVANAEVQSTESAGTWTEEDGTITAIVEGTEMTFTYDAEADSLGSYDDEGHGVVFARPTVEEGIMPDVVSAESEADFLGSWKIAYIRVGDMAMSSDVMGDEAATMVITEGQASMTNQDGAVEGTTEFVDGTLVIHPEGSESEVVLNYNSNGWLSISYSLDDTTAITTYYAPVEEE